MNDNEPGILHQCENCKYSLVPLWCNPCSNCCTFWPHPNWESDINGKVKSTDEMPDFQK